jgi:nucleoside-diphosphate-sugar epimerase
VSIVVIGAGGFTSFNLVKKLSNDQEVLAVLSDKHKNSQPGKFYAENNIEMLPSIESLLSKKLKQESKIVYLGGHAVSDHDFTDIKLLTKAYIKGVVQSLEVARKFNCQITIGGSYWELINNNGTNINLYASFQAAQNKLLEYFTLKYEISTQKVFLADSYGLNDWRPKLLQTIINSLETGSVINVGSPRQIIAPIYISDVVDDLVDIINMKTSNSESLTYLQLMPEKVYTLEQYINIIESVTKKTISIKWNTIRKERIEIENFPTSDNIYNSRKIRTTLKEGLSNILNFYN